MNRRPGAEEGQSPSETLTSESNVTIYGDNIYGYILVIDPDTNGDKSDTYEEGEEDEDNDTITKGTWYICTSVSIHMEMDEIPWAKVNIAMGTSLRNPGKYKQTADPLISSVFSQDPFGYKQMTPCEIWKVSEGSTGNIKDSRGICVFKGVVTAMNMAWSGGMGAKTVALQIMHNAIMLTGIPVGEYCSMSSSYLAALINGNGNADPGDVSGTSTHGGTIDIRQGIEEEFGDSHTSSTDILERAADIANYVIGMQARSVADVNGDPPKSEYADLIKGVIFSNYVINEEPGGASYGGAQTDIGVEWDVGFGAKMLNMVSGSSIWSMLRSILTSNTYMLTLCPRFSDQSFKLELMPSVAWDPGTPVELPIKYILGISTAWSPQILMDTPDVFLVNYYDAVSLSGQSRAMNQGYRPGIYMRDSTLAQSVRELYSSSENEKIDKEDGADLNDIFYRARYYDAPDWLVPLVMSEDGEDAGSLRTDGDGAFDKDNKDENDNDENSDSEEDPEQSEEAAANIAQEQWETAADTVAQALFTFIYGRSDTCIVEVSPYIRFGEIGIPCLESNIGKCIDIQLTGTSKFRGVTKAVDYSWVGGDGKGRETYEMTLTCTRMVKNGETEQNIKCPLYSKKS